MAKTIDLQISKSKELIENYKKNIEKLKDKGVTMAQLEKMSQDLVILKKANEECDSIRKTLAEKVRNMNSILLECKENYQTQKKIVKGYYPQEEWKNFGIPDKR